MILTKDSILQILCNCRPLVQFPASEIINSDFMGKVRDYLAIDGNDNVFEAKIILSHEDFLLDRESVLTGSYSSKTSENNKRQKFFYYVCPSGIVSPEELIDLPYIGLLWFNDDKKLALKLDARPLSFSL